MFKTPFLRLPRLILNTRYIKAVEIKPATASITVANTERRNALLSYNCDKEYFFHQGSEEYRLIEEFMKPMTDTSGTTVHLIGDKLW